MARAPRAAVLAACMAIIALGAVAFTSSSPPIHTLGRQGSSTSGAVGRRFTREGISFVYPPTWRAHSYQYVSTMRSLIVELSTEMMHPPCKTTSAIIRCGWPLDRLARNGVLVEVSDNAFSAPRLGHGTRMQVGGRAAKIHWATPGVCASIGAAETITVDIQNGQDHYYELLSCLAGPDTGASIPLFKRLVGSVTFTASAG